MAAQLGRRLRRGAATTAVAAVAMAALTASQAPEELVTQRNRTGAPSEDTPIDGGSSYRTELPPLNTPGKPESSIDLPSGPVAAQSGIPASVLAAYKKAEAELRRSRPGCNLEWELLAAIGKVESGQARGGAVDSEGTTLKPILGPQLNGNGFARITDTDNGAYDGDTTHDRAVGPMQFIPSTWATWGADGNGDGERDPNNVYDAALAAGRYLCAGGRDLSVDAQLHRAILGYNHSQQYLRTVLSWLEFYRKGTHEIPDSGGTPGAGGAPGGGKGGTKNETRSGSDDDAKPSGDSPEGSLEAPGGDPVSDEPAAPGGGGSSDEDPVQVVLKAIEAVTGVDVSAVLGDLFSEPMTVKAKDSEGEPRAGVPVTFRIQDTGGTGAQFPGGATVRTVVTGEDGKATAPDLVARGKAGSFTVRASAPNVQPVYFKATAKAPTSAEKVVRTGGDLAVEAGGTIADPGTVKATYKDIAVPDLGVTAKLLQNDVLVADQATPYFEDAQGNPVRSLELTTDENGVLKLPAIHTSDGTDGSPATKPSSDSVSYTLQLTAPGADPVNIPVTVTETASAE
ncbi:lytic transglycosylase domain-containing protein [Streptomyces meridianus]|uniref:Lytic murein transglycosylase n=1 Tax=Streptomyces meridianus TaxID=2938945 RepID=A0ABT0X1W1_9ACTN|nr:lytic murein transglycosylase [Streptomyces meridianus]MCM2576531.1 lytic murein transglycosylase [Streptomyces meridianus]